MKSSILQFMSAIVVTIVGVYAGYWLGSQPDDISKIEYRTWTSRNLEKILGGEEELKIQHAGEEILGISVASFTIVNNTRINISDINIYFEVENADILPIFSTVNPSASIPESAINLVSNNKGVYHFNLEYLNRSTNWSDAVEFNFYFGGNEVPNISVKTGTKGVSIQEYKREGSILDLVRYIVVYSLLAILAVLFALLVRTSRIIRKNEKGLRESIITLLSDDSESNAGKADKIIRQTKSAYLVNSFNKLNEAEVPPGTTPP